YVKRPIARIAPDASRQVPVLKLSAAGSFSGGRLNVAPPHPTSDSAAASDKPKDQTLIFVLPKRGAAGHGAATARRNGVTAGSPRPCWTGRCRGTAHGR